MAYIGYDGRAADIKKIDSLAASFNSVTTSFPVTVNGAPLAMSSAASVLISLGGVIQEPYVDYNAIGSNLVFVTAPIAGTSFFGVSLGASISIGTVGDNTVTNVKIGETISIAKGGTGAVTADAALSNFGATALGKNLLLSGTQATARGHLGLGDAATRTVGVSDGNLVQVISGGKLPILDGSNLTGIATTAYPQIASVSATSTSQNLSGGTGQRFKLRVNNNQSGDFWVAAGATNESSASGSFLFNVSGSSCTVDIYQNTTPYLQQTLTFPSTGTYLVQVSATVSTYATNYSNTITAIAIRTA